MSIGGMRGLLGLALVATLLAAYFAPPPGDDGVPLTEHSRTATSRTAPNAGTTLPARSVAATPPVNLLSIRPRESENDEDRDRATNAFAPTQWTPPPPKVSAPPIAAAPPPPPQAPPLPFQFMGRYVEGDQIVVFLKHNDQNLVVRVGDTIAENYKVESLKGGTLSLLYTPLNQKQTLEIGNGN